MQTSAFKLRAIAIALFWLVSGPALADNARVVDVLDGDTLTVRIGSLQLEVRIEDIDAPELSQPYGDRSRDSLAVLCLDQSVKLELAARDRGSDAVGRVNCGGKDASSYQVERGLAWVYHGYAPTNSPLYKLEAKARDAQRGLWADPESMPPWEWRVYKH